jgi:aarF domain-containing kinase
MAFGAVGETLRRATGSKDESNGSVMFSAGNMERLVAKLSKMRGAALKLGQMMSLQGQFEYIASSQHYSNTL